MNDNLKYATKLFGSATFSFLKINILGQLVLGLLSLISILTIVFQLSGQSGGGPAHAGGGAGILFLFMIRPIGFPVVFLAMLIIPFALFSLGNKYILSKTINKLLSDKGETILFPIIDKVLNKLKSKQPDLLKQGTDKTKLKLKVIQEIRDTNDNKWLKKIIIYGFEKVSLDDVDFTDKNVSFTDIIKNKMITGLKNVTEPSRNFFWIMLGIQITILVLISTKII
ncbi:hypothetical protein [Flavobacterium hercynium]|uniref:Uncharacterized protein n=1 Tax=Flavobacterium hercynium TaxID=387094 RepID=A0A226H1Y5_9FLAO|nr:hypothetical protein [Flavobacterium hercynium]OXA87651.1 hypothetical protein B0A66_16070 [Flavobacterium hercynium]SMP11006.1 hypothetical protein SAMN06265346_10361 [Flavobacterium hercynium]